MSTNENTVLPEGKTVTISSSYNSNASAYHTHECMNVKKMKSTREVDISVARWKEYGLCERCARKEDSHE